MNKFKKVIICLCLGTCLVFTLIVPCFASICYRDGQMERRLHVGNLFDSVVVTTRDYNTEVFLSSDFIPYNKASVNITQISPSDGNASSGTYNDRMSSQILSVLYGGSSANSYTNYLSQFNFGGTTASVANGGSDAFWSEILNASAFPGGYNSGLPFDTPPPDTLKPLLTDVTATTPPSLLFKKDNYIIFEGVENNINNVYLTVYFPVDEYTSVDIISALLTDYMNNVGVEVEIEGDYFDTNKNNFVRGAYKLDHFTAFTQPRVAYSFDYYSDYNYSLYRVDIPLQLQLDFDDLYTLSSDNVNVASPYIEEYNDWRYTVIRNVTCRVEVPDFSGLGLYDPETSISVVGKQGVSVYQQSFTMDYEAWDDLLSNYIPSQRIVIETPGFNFNPLAWVADTVGGFLNVEMFPGFPLYIPLAVCISIGVVFAFLKYFAGG